MITLPTRGSGPQIKAVIVECLSQSQINIRLLLRLQGSSVLEEDGRPPVHPGVPEPLNVFSQPQQDHSGWCEDSSLSCVYKRVTM